MADNIEQRVAHRYMKDRDGETYFPITHVDALIGLEQFDENIHNLEDAFKDFIGVTNWTSYANNVAPGVQTNTAYSSDGFKCEAKEVRIGVIGLTPIVRYKTITYNLRNFKLGEQVAQLPVGFMTKRHSFPAYGNGNMGAYRVEVTKSGAMTIFGGLNDKNLDTSSYWVYGQYTWIE
nr:hypothetical protein [Mammaliicoccus lentus]